MAPPEAHRPKSELITLLSRINSAVNPLLRRTRFPCSGGIHCRFAPRRTRFRNHFAAARLLLASRRAPIDYASQFENPMMISLFENNNVRHDYFSHSERVVHADKRRMA